MKFRWQMMLAMAVGLFGPAVSPLLAQGTIYTSLPQPLVVFSDLNSVYFPVDIDGDSQDDFTFGASPPGVALRTERANRLIYRPDPPPNLGGPVARLLDGFVVGSSLDPQLAWRSSDLLGGYVSPGEIAFATIVFCVDSGCLSDWPGGPATRSFIGIEFELSDGIHYGYFDVMVRGDIPGAAIHGWAYNSVPGQPITAFPVPEPSAGVMAGLGVVVMLIRRWRNPT